MTEETPVIEARRLHPLTLLYRLIAAIPNVAIPFLFVYFGGGTEEWIYILISIFVGIFILPGILLNYYYFNYTITDKEIVIRSGVLSKKERHIKIQRVQNISTSQNFLHKILNIAKVEFETAGGVQTEGVLDSISIKESERIREIVRNFQKESEKEEETAEEEIDENGEVKEESEEQKGEKVLFHMTLWDCIKYGAVRFRPIVLAISAWIFSIFSQFNPRWTEELESLLETGYKEYFKTLDVFELVLFGILSVFLILFISWILDIILTVNTYYNFTLSSEKNKLFTSQGLFSSKKGAIPLKKLQMMVTKSNPISRKLGFYRLDLQTAGFGGGGNDNQGRKAETAIPFAKFDEVKELIKKIRNVDFPEEFEKVSPKTIRRAAVRYFIVSIPVIITLYFTLGWILAVLLTLPVVIIGAIIRYQYRGFYIADDQVFIKQGFWVQKISLIPIEKFQTLHKRQSFFQRRLGLATVDLDTAATVGGADASIIDIDEDRAEEIFNQLDEMFIEKKNKSLKTVLGE